MADLNKRDRAHLHPFTSISKDRALGLQIEHAQGIHVYSNHGTKYLDALSGLWCVNVGYGQSQLCDAIEKTSRQISFAHTMFGTSHEAVTLLADRLLHLSKSADSINDANTSSNPMRKVFFGHSGSDANDTILKIARLYFLTQGQPRRTKYLSCVDSYHGTTLSTASLSGLPGHHRNFGLPDSSFLHVSAPDVFDALTRQGFLSEDAYVDYLVDEMEEAITAANAAGGDGEETIAAFFAEPVMAVGGILLPPATYFPRIKAVLDRHGTLLIVDDVICAFGRLGHWFGWQTTNVQPDMVSLAKGLTSGYMPMSAVLVGERVWSVFERYESQIGVFGHGFTMSGHPVAAAAALANIDFIEENKLLDRAREIGSFLLQTLTNATRHIATVVNVRGRGMLVGMQLAGLDASEVSRRCLSMGLIVRAIVGRNTVALAPPLITTMADVLIIVETICKALSSSQQ
ncbi:uncharacterized protein N7477_006426 [Penicillium maclennaniae]|uniref:uncharacterized protein n=1 Tax=Penicillium maclennaniae TaxID=1343394 RepID=UPI002540933E|nr:uncharacterized protein N7477_006426 [Penicillium maclennaniae]KAJ5667856.1 hypothetical protein N7477_006426 [Penicillium maclennaniae]